MAARKKIDAIETPVEKTPIEKAIDETAVKPVAKKRGRKPAAEKAAVKAEEVPAEAEKKPAAVKKAPARRAVKKELTSKISVQFAGKSYAQEDLIKIAKDVWKYDLKQKAAALTSIELYVKPEESVVYYVFNGSETGSFAI